MPFSLKDLRYLEDFDYGAMGAKRFGHTGLGGAG